MSLHLVKLCVGADSVDDLADWARRRADLNRKKGLGAVHDHVTRMFPRREAELLDGGSIYWVIKGLILARQPIRRFQRVRGEDGIERCAILLEPEPVATEPAPRRAFQGWRYLRAEDAPADARAGAGRANAALHAELAALGLL